MSTTMEAIYVKRNSLVLIVVLARLDLAGLVLLSKSQQVDYDHALRTNVSSHE